MDRESVEDLSRKEKEELNRKESVKELSSLMKQGFSREEKHIKMNATNKLLKQTFNQQIKLSKHLSTYMQSIHDPKHTHIHTLNKSNQFYISKIS